ncbi:MAG: DUF4386 domain-containing protein [Chloroflexota bacterium]
MTTNQRINSVNQTATLSGDKPTNIQRQAVTGAASYRRNAIATGVLFLITEVTSIGSFALYGPLFDHSGYITSSGSDTPVLLGVLFEIILAMANIGTAVALFPVVRKWNEGVALGYAALRTLEGCVIAVGVIPVLAVVTLRHLVGTAGSDPVTLATIGNVLIALHNWTILLGPGLVCGVNTVLMAYLMYKSGLVPRIIPLLGLIGGPLVFMVNIGKMFGLYDQIPPLLAILVLPIFAWEVSLAIWLIVKGFKSSATTSEPATAVTNELLSAA